MRHTNSAAGAAHEATRQPTAFEKAKGYLSPPSTADKVKVSAVDDGDAEGQRPSRTGNHSSMSRLGNVLPPLLSAQSRVVGARISCLGGVAQTPLQCTGWCHKLLVPAAEAQDVPLFAAAASKPWVTTQCWALCRARLRKLMTAQQGQLMRPPGAPRPTRRPRTASPPAPLTGSRAAPMRPTPTPRCEPGRDLMQLPDLSTGLTCHARGWCPACLGRHMVLLCMLWATQYMLDNLQPSTPGQTGWHNTRPAVSKRESTHG